MPARLGMPAALPRRPASPAVDFRRAGGVVRRVRRGGAAGGPDHRPPSTGLRREETRLQQGWTYEPSTCYETNSPDGPPAAVRVVGLAATPAPGSDADRAQAAAHCASPVAKDWRTNNCRGYGRHPEAAKDLAGATEILRCVRMTVIDSRLLSENTISAGTEKTVSCRREFPPIPPGGKERDFIDKCWPEQRDAGNICAFDGAVTRID